MTSSATHGFNRPPLLGYLRQSILPPTWSGRLSNLFLLFLTLGAQLRFAHFMDAYEIVILWGAFFGLLLLTQHWHPLRAYLPTIFTLALVALWLYQNDITRAEDNFLLKYFLSSAVAVLWMCTLLFSATIAYWLSIKWIGILKVARALLWASCVYGGSALLVRWAESYLIGDGFGHIPISNLYEVFVLFSVMTSLFYLSLESRHRLHQLGAVILLVISLADAFLLWYAVSRDAAAILPLVPALQSWWMKVHVPANFVGYSMFSIAAMAGVAYLFKVKGYGEKALPALITLDGLLYKTIAIGFAFFTLATILGALWAAEAWGGYWSWDPKEVWALIVWLNYAAWLHQRLRNGHSQLLAWWSVVGLLLTAFAFLGVNMFLSGLHSYGAL